jgi:hypothetical protein
MASPLRRCGDAHAWLCAAGADCVPRATALRIIFSKGDIRLFFAVLCIYSRGRFRSAVCPGS